MVKMSEIFEGQKLTSQVESQVIHNPPHSWNGDFLGNNEVWKGLSWPFDRLYPRDCLGFFAVWVLPRVCCFFLVYETNMKTVVQHENDVMVCFWAKQN